MADEWRDLRWGDLATLEYGRAFRGHGRGRGPFRVFGTNGPIGWHDKALCSHSSVIIGRKGAYRGVHFSAAPFFVIDTAFYLEPKSELDPRWAYYELLTQDINGMDSGSAIPSTSREAFYSLQVRVPPFPEQRRIVSILGALDDKIELNRQMNRTLEEMAQAIFKSWFIDFDGHDDLVESELGLIPRGWEVKRLEDLLAELETGERPKGGVSKYLSGVPSIGAESIVGLGIFDYSKTKYVPQQYFDLMKKGRVQGRDVLLYKDGGRPGQFEPHMTMFGDGFPFATCAINEHVYRLRAKAGFGQNLLYFWLSSDLVMAEMRTKGTGVAIPGLNSTQVKSLTTLVPAPTAVADFDAIVDPMIARILAACNESTTLASLRDALLPKLISGEIRVPEAEEILEEAL